MNRAVHIGPTDWRAIAARRQRERIINAALQVGLVAFSLGSMFLLATTGPWQRWGFVVGLAGQPLWFLSTWRSNQPGLFVVSLFYTVPLVLGIANRFDF